MTTRSFAYALARFLGDVNAVRRGRIGRRLANKAIGRHVVSRLWR
jgi:rRNA maturation protein Rpf1